MVSGRICRTSAMAAALIALGGCGAEATVGQAASNDMGAPSGRPMEARRNPRTSEPAPAGLARRAVECPATLASGMSLPGGSRLLGAPLGTRLSLTSATVSADAVGTMPADLDGIAEVEPVERPGPAGMAVQVQDAAPTSDAPFTLICRYGDVAPPLLARSVVLVPLPADGARYGCVTRLPQGRDRRVASARCEPS